MESVLFILFLMTMFFLVSIAWHAGGELWKSDNKPNSVMYKTTEKRHNRNTGDTGGRQIVSGTEFKKELATMVDYAVNHAKPGVDVVDIFADRIFDCAKLEITKDLPIWKRSEKLIEGALLDRGALYIPRYMIELSELKKLPKEE